MIFCCSENGLFFRSIESGNGTGRSTGRIDVENQEVLVVVCFDGHLSLDSSFNNTSYEVYGNTCLFLFYPIQNWKAKFELNDLPFRGFLLKINVLLLHGMMNEQSNLSLNEVVKEGWYNERTGINGTVFAIRPQMRMLLHQLDHPLVGLNTYRPWIRAKILELFSICLDATPEIASRGKCPYFSNPDTVSKIYEVKDYLLKNPHLDYSTAELAKRFEMKEHALKTAFRKAFGSGVKDFSHQLKMEKARELLEVGEYKVNEVAFKVGYSNSSHFIAAFKRKYGETPSVFAKNQLEI